MITIILIISFVFLLAGIILFYKANNIKIQRTNEKNKIQQQIVKLQKDCQDYQKYISREQKELSQLLNQKYNISQTIKKQQKELQEWYNNHKKIAIDKLNKQLEENRELTYRAYESYCDTIDKVYKTKEEKITWIEARREQVEKQLAQIKSVYQAATAARLRQQEDEEKLSFYKIKLTDKQATDISRLQEWKQNLYDPTIVSKIIWSTYILKPTSDLCNRVLGSKPVCGIYKITNKATGEIYIGQSVNIAQRWKTHIKCGLGIDASSTNKLYNTMQHTGVWNFTFELLQQCSRDKLNEKERFWIEMYQSNKVGMNTTKGNK